MTRLFLASIAVVSTLAVVPYSVKAQQPTLERGVLPNSNQVYVKIILPADPATDDMDRPVVESWIAEHLTKRGQSKFTAATGWVPLISKWDESTRVWDGRLNGKTCNCPVSGHLPERTDGRLKILLDGWAPAYASVTVSLKDEPGSRAIAGVEEAKAEQGLPHVAVLIGPPPEHPAVKADHKE